MNTPPDGQAVLQLIAPSAIGLDSDFTPKSMVLFELLQTRQSERAFSTRPLPLYTLSRLFWAAFGINRPETGRRTAPSARDGQEIVLYVALPHGLYRFDAGRLALLKVSDQDLRAATGLQDFVAEAPLNLIYVAQLTTDSDTDINEQMFCAALDTGFISQNVYLFCAAERLATVVRGWIDREALARAMGLGPNERIVAAQSVGYPLP